MDLPNKRYNILYADPPWRFRVWNRDTGCGRSADSHYRTMILEEIKALPVGNIVDKDCTLFLWATCPMIPEALEVMQSWGFSYKTIAFVWVKRNKKAPTWFTGMGYWTRANAEVILLGTKGNPKRVNKNVHQIIDEPIRRHSQKPDITRKKIVDLMGDLPRIELFARLKDDTEYTEGWDFWGDEV